MKKILLSVLSTGLLVFPLVSSANGVLCTVTVPLNPIIIAGGSAAFQTICRNNTSNRNYTDFSIINSSGGNVTTTSSCGTNLPVGQSCVINGVFTPSSTANNNFSLGLNYGGTIYPTYPGLSFATTVNSLNFTTTSGPNGGDITFAAYARVPDGTGNYYALGDNVDISQSDIYFFNNTTKTFTATGFPLPTVNGNNFSSSIIMAADQTGNLYVGAIINGPEADTVWRYDAAGGTWAPTNYNVATMGTALDLTVNKDGKVFATTSNGTQVWQYDGVTIAWVSTNFPSTLASFSFNQKTTFLMPDHSLGLIYGMTATTIYSFDPQTNIWLDTRADVPFTAGPLSIFVDDSDLVYASGYTAGTTYDIYTYQPPTTWNSTNFQLQTSLNAPNYPSFIDIGSGVILTSGLNGSNHVEIYSFATPTWSPTTNFGSAEVAVTFSTQVNNIAYAASFDGTLGDVTLWKYIPSPTNAWSSLDFPNTSNKTQFNLISVNSADDIFAVMTNGSYQKQASALLWKDASTGLYADTSRFEETLNGTLFVLNERQFPTKNCSNGTGDPNTVYDNDWSNFPDENGFIEVFQNPLGTWSDTSFPNTPGPSYLYTPLVSNSNDLFAAGFTSGAQDVFQYTNSWASTSFPGGVNIYLCMQGALTVDSNSNLYAVTYVLGTYTIYERISGSWGVLSGAMPAGVVRQLMVDHAGTPYIIAGTVPAHVYKYTGGAWVDTNFSGTGTPTHLTADSSNNVYAVSNSVDVYKYNGTSWSSLLGGTGIPVLTAGKIYQQLLADSASNLYARTRNTATNVDSVWKYTPASDTWTNLGSSVLNFPITAIVNDLTVDVSTSNVYVSTSQGLYIYSGNNWFQLSNLPTDQFLTNGAGNYYQVTNNKGVYLGSLT